jgi:hypothetical protein
MHSRQAGYGRSETLGPALAQLGDGVQHAHPPGPSLVVPVLDGHGAAA